MELFQKNNVTLNQGAKDFSDVYELAPNADGFKLTIDNSGNGGLWDNKSDTTVLSIQLYVNFDGSDIFPEPPMRSVTINGGTSCPIGRDGQPNCISIMGLGGLPPEQNAIPRRIEIALDLEAVEPSEKTLQIKNYTVEDDL